MIAAITPGPNNIILSTNAVNHGFRKTIPLIMGVFFGFLSVLTLCLLGIGEIYKSFPAIALIIKIVAICFLTYLSYKIFISSMSSRQSGALKSVEVMLNASLIRLNNLNGENREALYDEYKEWLEVDDDNVINDGVLYCNYLG